MDFLVRIAVIAYHFIFQMVVIVFQSGCQVQRHKQELVEAIGILCSRHKSEVGSLAVGIRVLCCTIITVAVGVLG